MLVVITPIGFTLGSAYTVITKVRPNLVILMPSRDTTKNAQKIIGKLKKKNNSIKFKVKTFETPYDLEQCVHDVLSVLHCLDLRRKRIIINVTGGTTAMSSALFYVAEIANLDVILTFDERPYVEQLNNPWTLTCLKKFDQKKLDQLRREILRSIRKK